MIIRGKVNTILRGYLDNEEIYAYDVDMIEYYGKYGVEINYKYKSDFYHICDVRYRMGQDMTQEGVGFEL